MRGAAWLCSVIPMSIDLAAIFETITQGGDLTRAQTRAVFDRIMTGALPDTVIAGLLGALATKGESVDELVGAAEAMRARAVRVRCDAGCIDTCGTGGDGVSTFNVSTTAAIIAAAAGAIVAKHGNRSTTRVSGSTEVLTLLGIDVDAPVPAVERALIEAHIGYLNARRLHPAMSHAAPVRQALPVRTIFNLLGPLTNPAGARRQLLGVPRPELTEKLAEVLASLGTEHAWVVHGEGLCDVTITGTTIVVEVKDGVLHRFTVSPDDAGLEPASLDALRVSSSQQSAAVVLDILKGTSGAPRDHALMNAGAALVVAGVAGDLREGVTRAGRAIDEGDALRTLEQWRCLCGAGG